ncbi:MAG: 16S rRNA (adenine(1518)-N(6)/adenine(1519)-N(6))-dimethyltransferase RsmA [Betaproteobacteria bacterium]|nr:16S rRNA (adenine(1518)-N(6)/adenine(1519)-N(6))-dimethyltransferase RsmA [Betaproteobacteria bacterium]MCL2887293.1 16S rRNA (adenine(1518)-N(6)/adenine(1519)-N(6))-dimethyltransferase RsmA [Betaproteobacteria bacterium]
MKHIPRRRFGQNFLIDAGIINAIVAAIDPQGGDRLVEIGPGLGALTEPLLARLDHLHVVEIDRDLIARLQKRHPPARLSIHEGDALAFDFAAIGDDLRLVGNLPYNISTPLLFHLADYGDSIRDMHFMLQKEVVERMVAVPGDGDFGRLSVMLQYRFHLEWLLDVPPESFDPPPKVQSAVVRLIPKAAAELTAKNPQRLADLVRAAFAQRRKMLRNTLKGVVDEAAFAALDIDPTRRPEDLAVADYVRIANYLGE